MTCQSHRARLNSVWFLALGFFVCVQTCAARELSAREQQCLAAIEAEVAFITSRVELIHGEYEEKVQLTGLENYQSGDYSTITWLDNSIRKYRLSLVIDVRSYPQRYKKQVQTGSQHCPAEQLKVQGIGMIHDFEKSWSQALEKAQQNADYFRRLEEMN